MNLITINIIFWMVIGMNFSPVAELQNGLVLEVANTTYMFTHGDIKQHIDGTQYHVTMLDGIYQPTIKVLEEYDGKIVGTWCNAGDFGLVKYKNGTVIPFPERVKHNKQPGTTIPFLTPFGVILLPEI